MKKDILIVDERFKDFVKEIDATLMTPMQYIVDFKDKVVPSSIVYNLSSDLQYQGIGYYVSLMALARNHRVFPDPTTIQDLKDRSMQSFYSESLDELIQQNLSHIKGETFELSVYFGKNMAKQHATLAKELYKIVRAPIFRVVFEKDHKWLLQKIKILQLSEISEPHLDFFSQSAKEFFSTRHSYKQQKNKFIYDLAILVNPEEKSPPSDEKAIKKFVEAGKKVGFRVDVITKKDTASLLEYDALFIRETTSVNHHTYRMARRAAVEGLVVIDDPESILKCTNKAFLEEVLDRQNIKRPQSVVLNKANYKLKNAVSFGYPRVIKRPDSAFSQGVYKAESEADFLKKCEEIFKYSDLILVQEFLPTDFDWRVGVLNNEPIFVCKYFMAPNHWQIISTVDGEVDYGDFESLEPSRVPAEVIKTALKACKCIGKGLYGVDLKQKGKDIYVIEVNDNPNLDVGVEDKFLGDELYKKIMEHFLYLCNKKRKLHHA